MNRQLNSPSGGATIANVLQPYEGGLGTTSAAAALAAMGALASTQVGVANGVAQLTGEGLVNPDNVPADGVTLIALQGPNSMGINSMATFEITNYDAFTTYDLVALAGTVVRYKSTITYYSSGSAGQSGFRINGKLVSIAIVGDRPATPVITAVTSGSSKSVTAVLTSSAFAMNSGTGTHAGTDWQIATDTLFDNIVKSSMFNTTNLTTMTFNDLAVLKTYYARCRYRDNNGNYSPWSIVIAFATKDDYKIDTEERKIVAPVGELYLGFANGSIGIAADGSRCIVGTSGEDISNSGNEGSAYIFVRSGLTWALEQKIRSSDIKISDFFGQNCDMNADGTRVICSSVTNDQTTDVNEDSGAAYIFVRNGTTWTQEAKIVATDRTAGKNFSRTISMDATGTRVLCGALQAVYVFTRSGTTWTQEAKISGQLTAGADFPAALDIDDTGTRLVFGSAFTGNIYIFLRTGTTWAQEQTWVPPIAQSAAYYGYRACISSKGDRLAVSARAENAGGITGSGAVYTYSRNGTVWTQDGKFVPTDPLANAMFGYNIAMSGDGLRVAVCASDMTVAGLAYAGVVYVFAKQGASWVQESKLGASDTQTNAKFGSWMAFAADGSRLIASGVDNSVSTGGGAVYIYR